MIKYFYVFLFGLIIFPNLAFAQVDNRPAPIEGNRVIISEQEVPQIVPGNEPSSFNKHKVKYILIALGLLVVAGYAAVQLVGPTVKPKAKQ